MTNIERVWERIRDPRHVTLLETLGIEIVDIGQDFIRATMPVDERTKQYYGLLHGGASLALAESLASLGALVHVDLDKETIVGLEINANHIRSVKSGRVNAEGKPLHVGRRTQVWSVEIKNEEGKLVSVSRCTIAVVPRTGDAT